jgi:hypothetical protein
MPRATEVLLLVTEEPMADLSRIPTRDVANADLVLAFDQASGEATILKDRGSAGPTPAKVVYVAT